MNPFANYMSERADRVWFIIWLVVFIASGAFITWFGWTHTVSDADASPLPVCKNNAAIIGHNKPLGCDLTHGGILIELGTSRLECANQGGRFLIHFGREACFGEDI